jgi:hypothetical protein
MGVWQEPEKTSVPHVVRQKMPSYNYRTESQNTTKNWLPYNYLLHIKKKKTMYNSTPTEISTH